MNQQVRIFEVGPRDGLQNEKAVVSAADKIRYINLLAQTGITRMEATSFVRPGVIPQLADADEVYRGIEKTTGVRFSALTPNVKGMENALAAGVQEAAVFTAASDAFTLKNINCTIEESLRRFHDVIHLANEADVPVRGYVSTVVECPYVGPVEPRAVLEVCHRLLELGVYEISLGDTIGVGTPADISRLLDVIVKEIPPEKLAGHFHDTRGTAVANVFCALNYGIRVFDSSAGGFGGCPYAPGAAGNASTEDLVYSLERAGYKTGINMDKLCTATTHISNVLGRMSASRSYLAELARKERGEKSVS